MKLYISKYISISFIRSFVTMILIISIFISLELQDNIIDIYFIMRCILLVRFKQFESIFNDEIIFGKILKNNIINVVYGLSVEFWRKRTKELNNCLILS